MRHVGSIAVRPAFRFGLVALLMLIADWPGRLAAESKDAGWEPIRSADGITTWKTKTADRPLPAFRSQALFEASVWDVLAVLEDVNRAAEWMANCAEMRRLEHATAEAMTIYARLDAPWPVSDRDVISQVQTTYASPKELHVDLRAVSHAGTPELPSVVRIRRMIASYHFTVRDGHHTLVAYEIDVDPGGALPGWLKRLVARDMAHDALARLRERVAWAVQRGLYRARAAQLAERARRAGFQG